MKFLEFKESTIADILLKAIESSFCPKTEKETINRIKENIIFISVH
jgi:hypothetical protein